MRFSRYLLHNAHEATTKFVVPRLRERLLASEIQDAVEYIKTERVRYADSYAKYEKKVSEMKETHGNTKETTANPDEPLELQEEIPVQLPTPPKATVPLTGNPYFATLPLPLANFFKKYPPSPFRSYSNKSTNIDDPTANPFLANVNPLTGRYQDPVYSLRRQSDLYKTAYRYGIAHLLPPLANKKIFYEEKYESKPPLRGATQFKLSIAERKAPSRKIEMAEAISKADETIAKARGLKWRRRLEKKQKKPLPWF